MDAAGTDPSGVDDAPGAEDVHGVGDAPGAGRLAGCTVVVTRDEPGELGRLLDAEGARVVHLPLIEITGPDDDGAALRDALDRLDSFDWLIVTSTAGADRVGDAASASSVALGAVGTATARRLATLSGRSVDLVPQRQVAASLADEFVARVPGLPPRRVLLALADRAGTELAERLLDAGHDVTSVVAYRTRLRRPAADELAALADVDAVLFASGSAAIAWSEAFGERAVDLLPDVVVAIGPTTAQAAADSSLKISSVATDHSLSGLVDELVAAWKRDRGE